VSAGDRVDDVATGSFVGRVDALADLDRVMRRAEAGRGAFALVTGEPGMGKTTLVEHAAGGRRVLWGRAAEHLSAPLGLWRQVALAAAGAAVALDPDVTQLSADAVAGGTGAERYLRFDAVIGCLREASRENPFVVVLDDLQWADRESRALLELLVGDLDWLPIAVVGITRPELASALPRAAVTIELAGLGTVEVRALVGSVTGGRPDDEVVDAAIELTGGNPFFVGEVARHLRASGAALDAASWRGVLPHGARSLLSRQLAALDSGARDAVHAAAVLGASFDVNELAAMLHVDRAAAYSSLDPIVGAGLLRDAHDGTFVFAHALVRDAARAELDLSTRHELHLRAADVVESLHGEAAAAAVAAHYAAAGDREQSASWWERAGERAYASAMYADACEYFEAACTASTAAPTALQLRLAESLSRTGETDRARELFLEIARAARAGGDAAALAQAALGVGSIGGGFEIRVLDVEQIALLEEVLAGTSGRGPARSRIMARLSVALSLDVDHARRVTLATGAVELARTEHDDAALVHALAAWCDAHAGPAHIDARLQATEEMLAAAVRSGDPELELLTRRFRIVALMESGQIDRATPEIRAFARLADSLRQPAFQWYARVVEGMLALLHGDLDAAEELGTIAQETGRRAQSANADMLTGGLLAMARRERGDPDGFLQTITAGNSGYAEATRGYDFLYPLFLVGYGVDPATVADILARMPVDVSWADNDALYLMVWTTFGDAAAFIGETARMDDAREHLLPFASRFALDGTASVCYGPVSATLARIARARGDVDAAQRWYDDALTAISPIDAPLIRARLERERAEGESAPRAPSTPTVPADAARFEREGDTWLLAFTGRSTRLRDAKGLRDLAVLLARPDGEVHALDLVAASEGHGRSDGAADGDVGPALDARARGEYEARIRDLTELIEDAEGANDIGRAARLDDERAQLLRELAAALGLSGRARSQSSDAERARKAVTMRIRDAIGRIDRELPALGSHLRNSVRTGIFCSYRPEQPVEWRL